MTVTIERYESAFGDVYHLQAFLDKFHKGLVREFYNAEDARKFGVQLLSIPLDKDILALFILKR